MNGEKNKKLERISYLQPRLFNFSLATIEMAPTPRLPTPSKGIFLSLLKGFIILLTFKASKETFLPS